MSLQQQQKQADDYKEEFELIFEDEKGKEMQSIIFTAFSRIPWREFISNISKKQRCEKETFKSFACKKKGDDRILIKPNQTFSDLITKLNYSIIIIQKYFSINDKNNCNVMNKWLFCPSREINIIDCDAITIKNNTLLLASVEGEQGDNSWETGIGYKLFNLSNNQWSPSWIDLHGDCEFSCRTISDRFFYWHQQTDYLYVITVYADQIVEPEWEDLSLLHVNCEIMIEGFIITDDITNNAFKDTRNYSIDDKTLKIINPKPKYHYNESEFMAYCRISPNYFVDAYHIALCQINDEIIHMVIFYKSTSPMLNRHFTWNRETNEVKLEHIFHAGGDYPTFIHLRKNKCLMLIGRMGIVIYCLIKKIWYKLLTKIKFEIEGVDCLITEKEDKVIIAGGYESNKIWIYDVLKQTLKESCVVLPAQGKCKIFTNNSFKDELLIIGWLRNLFKHQQIDQRRFPPMYLIQMILSWYHLKMLYWIASPLPQHQAIEMSYIMNNVKQ